MDQKSAGRRAAAPGPEWAEVTRHGRPSRPGRRSAILAVIAAVGFGYLWVLQSRLVPGQVAESAVSARATLVWPREGEAAVLATGWSRPEASPDQRPAPIASLAKVMTAFIVLREHPLADGEDGPILQVSPADVEDTEARATQDQSVVRVAAGEGLSERQALQAILIPSANNVAAMLARWVAGSVEDFVVEMNATARSWRLGGTRYTDPSGFDPATVSTASDQLEVLRRALRVSVLAQIVRLPSVALPVAGIVRNTDTMLGRDGFVGVKTGSDDAAGGCFAFESDLVVAGRRVVVLGVVLGQRGGRGPLPAAFDAARSLVEQAGADQTP